MSGLEGALTFVRRVDVPFDECLFALETWALRPGSAGSIRIGRSRLSPAKSGEYPAKPGEGGVDGEHVLRSGHCKLSVLLYGGSLRPLPMELLLLPWSSLQGVTYLELVPRRAVRPSKRYYGAGNSLLDELITGLRSLAFASQETEEAV